MKCDQIWFYKNLLKTNILKKTDKYNSINTSPLTVPYNIISLANCDLNGMDNKIGVRLNTLISK